VIATLVARAGYRPGEPVLAAVRAGGRPAEVVTQGGILVDGTRFYTASLSKQLTAACAALLVRSGRLDIDAPLARWLPKLPPWAAAVRLRHLVHHTAGLPADDDLDGTFAAGADRTTDAVLAALRRFPSPARPPGTVFRYSNAGYVCLGVAVARAAGRPLPEVARHLLFAPSGMDDTVFWAGPEPMPPGGLPLASRHPAPLSLGDGGVWSTAGDLLRWTHVMNTDGLGIAALVETPGTLDDGRVLDYAWGTGVRAAGGRRVHRHGGGWPGVRLLLARVPDLGLGVLVVAADDSDRHVALADALLAHGQSIAS
jgi:CubicO group peptidase (beta-lactamase class C family)